MKTIRILRITTLVLLACGLGIGWYRLPGETLDDLGPVGKFAFQSSTGDTVTEADLSGKISVVGCFFTCCTTQCPILSGSMARLQSEFKAYPDIRLISITVDPERDTPEKLSAYAKTYGADPNRWQFLYGSADRVESFIKNQLKQGFEKNAVPEPGNEFLHSERLILIDRSGQIRGFFQGTDPAAVDGLKSAAIRLHG